MRELTVGGDVGGRVYIIIVTWNNQDDAVECLDSIFRTSYRNFVVVVCDNDSRTGTLRELQEWAANPGRYCRPADSPVESSGSPLGAIASVSHSREEAEAGGGSEDEHAGLVFVQTGANLGYSGGNNVGIKYALARGDADYLWILNGDTVVSPDALGALVAYCRRHSDAGLVGVPLMDYDEPTILQAYGGATWNYRTAQAKRLAEGCSILVKPDPVELDLIIGASMFATRRWLSEVGLLEERYFLYCEEIDWAVRRGPHLRLGVAEAARVYHKSRTVGKSGLTWRRWYYFHRARLLFTAKHCPRNLPVVIASVARAIGRRAVVIGTFHAATLLKRMLALARIS